MKQLPRVNPGDAITAASYNRLVDAMNSLAANVERLTSAREKPKPPAIDLVEIKESEDIEAGDFDKKVNVFTRDSSADEGEDQWKDADYDLTLTMDPQMGLYLAGERHLTYFHPGAGQRIPIPGVLFQIGVADEAISEGEEGDVVVHRFDGDDTEATDFTVTAFAWGASVTEGSKVFLYQHRQSRKWIIVTTVGGPEVECETPE